MARRGGVCAGRLRRGGRLTSRDAGATFLETIGWFCYQQHCPVVVGRTITFRENDHITQTYTLELREVFRDAFTKAVK